MTIANNRDIFEVTPEQSLGFRNNWKVYSLAYREQEGRYFAHLLLLGGKQERLIRSLLGI